MTGGPTVPDVLAPVIPSVDQEGGPPVLLDLGPLQVEATQVRTSAILLLVAGETLDDLAFVVEERGHLLRTQPGQYSFAGGGVDPEDASRTAAALREAQEEIGLDPEEVLALGEFRPIVMPWRGNEVTPVLAWARTRPHLFRASPDEVESVAWVPVCGPASLSDASVRCTATLDGRRVGIAFDLPEGVFLWGFTAYILEELRRRLTGAEAGTPERVVEVPTMRRRTSGEQHRGPAQPIHRSPRTERRERGRMKGRG